MDINIFILFVLVNMIKGKGFSIKIGEYKVELIYKINLFVDVLYLLIKELLKLVKVFGVIFSIFY